MARYQDLGYEAQEEQEEQTHHSMMQGCPGGSSSKLAQDRAAPPPGSPARNPPNQAIPSLAGKRRAASEFLRAATGASGELPYATDQGFRAALQDGVLLCRLANALWPGSIPQILEAHAGEEGPAGLLVQRDTNCHAFLSALAHAVPLLPADCVFSVADLEAEHEERPAVATCLLFLRSLAASSSSSQQHAAFPAGAADAHDSPLQQHHQHFFQQQQQQPHHSAALVTPPMQRTASRLQPQQQPYGGAITPGSLNTPAYGGLGASPAAARMSYSGTPGSLGALLRSGSGAGAAAAGSPLMDGPHGNLSSGGAGGAAGMLALRASTSSLPGTYVSAASSKGAATAQGVTKLMQQCTSMLKERMFPMAEAAPPAAHPGSSSAVRYGSPAGSDSAMKALGPVLEGVLGQLTEEYERRILSINHELCQARDARARAERDAARAQEQVARLQQEVDERAAAAAAASAQAASADVDALRSQLAAARAELAARESELTAAHAALSSADGARADAFSALQAESMMLRTRLGELLDVDERYRRVVAENRDLYNTVQDLRGNIRVFCRIRPAGLTGDLSPSCVDVGLEGDLAVYEQASGTKRLFKVDRVFDQGVDQAAIYDDTQPLIRSVLDGFNVCIFAYGQTGSGKTHTMSGTNTATAGGRGINYRALDDLFGLRDSRSQECEYTFRVQMLEIYNEALRDLLADSNRSGPGLGQGPPNKLDILATQASGCNVPGATQVEVQSAADVVALMARGAAQRATSETKMNDRSSRSHQILTVVVDGFHSVTKATSHGCLHLIDLAGSERVGKSEASGDRLVEAQHINKSLSALGDVMAALASKSAHVPYRNSKLTQLLQDSLQGNAKVMMFMHVSPEGSMFGETVSTLKFASRVSQITLGQAKKNVVSGKVFEAHEEVVRQQRDMHSLEQQLAQANAALSHHKARGDALQAEVGALRQQLAATAGEATTARASSSGGGGAGGGGGTPDTGSLTARQRSALQLPLQQMFAQQAAAAAAAAAAGASTHNDGSLTARSTATAEPASARGTSGGGAGGTSGSDGGAGAGSSSKLGRMRVDRTPPRDQDECSLPSQEHSRAGGLDSLSPLGLPFPQYGGEPDPTPRTARSTRSSSGGGGNGALTARSSLSANLRGSASAARHMERLASARQSGMFKPGGGSPAAAGGGGGGGGSPGGSGLSHIVSKVAAAISGGRGSTMGGGSSGAVTSRSHRDVAERAPQTSRVAGVARSKTGSEGGAAGQLPSFTSRQSGVYGGGSGAAGAGRPSGAVTARGTSTSRGGSRWK